MCCLSDEQTPFSRSDCEHRGTDTPAGLSSDCSVLREPGAVVAASFVSGLMQAGVGRAGISLGFLFLCVAASGIWGLSSSHTVHSVRSFLYFL